MDNHYYLLIEAPEGNLSVDMRQLNGLYTQRFNRRHGRVGHIFQGRYKAILVDRDSYLLELSRYIVLNPVRAGLVTSAADTPWSSYRATAGLEACPPYLHTDWILAQFGSSREQAVERYRQFVSEGIGQGAPWDAVKGQLLLGSEAFVAKMSNHLHAKRQLNQIPRTRRFADRPSLEAMHEGLGNGLKAERNRRIRQAHLEYDYSLTDIGKVFGLHYSTVSKIMKAAEEGGYDSRPLCVRVLSVIGRSLVDQVGLLIQTNTEGKQGFILEHNLEQTLPRNSSIPQAKVS